MISLAEDRRVQAEGSIYGYRFAPALESAGLGMVECGASAERLSFKMTGLNIGEMLFGSGELQKRE